MAKFETVKDVQKAFLMRSGGSDVLENHRGFRYGDIEKLAPVVESFLKTDYNNIIGYNFSEVMEQFHTSNKHLEQELTSTTLMLVETLIKFLKAFTEM